MSITINIYYTGTNGGARKFAQEMVAAGIVEDIRAEEGNERYEYFFPEEDQETVLLIDQWKNQKALDLHHKSPMMKKIASLREKYKLHMRVDRYVPDMKSETSDLTELVKKNRSYRGFDQSHLISREQLETYVALTRYTASSVNQQPLRYYIATAKGEVEALTALTGWAKALPEIHLPEEGRGPVAYIIICQDMERSDNLARFQRDVGIVAQTILLRAAEDDLGGCMIGSFSPGKVREAIPLSENVKPLLIVALGKPDETIVLEDVVEGRTGYYRDENGVHHVPKRKKEELLLN